MYITEKQDIYGMSRVGYVGELEVYVNTNDAGNIPHFHLRDSNNWDKFHTCICIDKAEYFHHNGKEDILNSKQRKELQEFMLSKVSVDKYADKFENNWELVCFLWDMNNSSVNVPEGIKMPNYLELK